MFRQFNHFDKKFDTRIGSLDTRVGGLETKVSALDTKVDALDAKVDALDAKVDALDAKVDRMGGNVSDARERLARIEGHLMAPEGFRIQRPQPSAASDPPPEDPGPAHRQTG